MKQAKQVKIPKQDLLDVYDELEKITKMTPADKRRIQKLKNEKCYR